MRAVSIWWGLGLSHSNALALAHHVAFFHGKFTTAPSRFYYFGDWAKFCFLLLTKEPFFKAR